MGRNPITTTAAMKLTDYLSLLAANNNRPWFQAHRDLYDEQRERWYAHLDRLFAAAAPWEPLAAYTDGRRASYRIYRDTRFSADKTPYKTYFSARLEPPHGTAHVAGWYIQAGLTREETGLFGGLWAPDAAQLRKLRRAIVDNIEEFEEIINEPRLAALYPGWWGPALKTAPKGWDKDHPQIHLLRLLNYGREMPLDPGFFDDPAWPERAADLMRPLKPLNDFLNYSLAEDI